MRGLKRADGLASLVFAASTLLPWIELGDVHVTAFVLPSFAIGSQAPGLLALWLMPILSALLVGLRVIGRQSRWLDLFAGLAPLVSLAVITLVIRNGLYPVLGPGWYVAGAAGFVLTAHGLGVLGPAEPAPAPS